MNTRCLLAVIGLLVFASSCTTTRPAGSTPTRRGLDSESPRLITIDRLHDGGDFSLEGFRRVRWLEDGSAYTTLEDAEGGGRDIVRHDPATGTVEVLVSADRLTPTAATEPLTIADYSWSSDGRKLLVFTNTRRVWRAHTRGDYWVLDLDTDDLRQLGGELEGTWFQFAKFAPDGTRVGYVHKNDLWVEDLATGRIDRLTASGSEAVSNGTFDWVYEEEWGLRDGFRWSPDGQRIAFWQIDASDIREFVLVDYTADLYPTVKQYRYPKVGTVNPRCRVGIVDAGGGGVRWIELPGDERDDYVARMEWAASNTELVLQRINRRQNQNRVLLADVQTGRTREIFRDEDPAWVEVCDDLVWLDDGQRFTFVSERAGWSQVYVISRDGAEVRLVTPGEYDVIRIVRIDEAGRQLYFIASPDEPTRRFLYRVPLSGSARPLRVTPPEAVGTHDYQVSPDAHHAIHTSSAFETPPLVALVTLPDHGIVRTFVTNDRVVAHLEELDRGPVEFFRVPVDDGVEVDGYAIMPPGFDRRKKYPMVVYVYGEPAGQTARDRWGGGTWLWHLMLSQMGYVVVSLDNRGTPSPRGRDWRKSVYGQIGILASRDQATAVRALLERWDFLDSDRIGVWGWSGGGSMTLNAMFRYPDLYDVGIAIAFIANQRYYDTIYQERYMGLPDDNPDGFEQGSPITFAHRLEGDLLLVYGTGDDNCHYQNCEALVNELVAHGKQFEMMAYPGRSHSISEGPGTRKHLYTKMTQFLLEHLPPGPR